MDETRKELKKAQKMYKSKKYKDALEIYEREYDKKPEKFDIWAKRYYSWCIYYLHIKEFENEDELIDATVQITELIPQADLNKAPVCCYTLSVLNVMKYYYDLKEYDLLLQWAGKLNVELLDNKHKEFNGKISESSKEKYYNRITKAYWELKEYDLCIESSKQALESMDEFVKDNDIWYKWRLGKSLKEMGEYEEAIKYIKEVSEVKKDWYIDKEIADCYYFESDYENSLKYAVQAVLKKGDIDKKVNLYPIIRDLIKKDYPEEALKHDYLVYSIRLANDWGIEDTLTDRIEEAGLDIENKNYKAIQKELMPFWKSLKYKNQELKYGTITKIFDHGKAGFITSENNERYYFKIYDIVGDKSYLREYASVSFYTEKGFDKSKNKESINAVNIELI